jgi:hypothetical protein
MNKSKTKQKLSQHDGKNHRQSIREEKDKLVHDIAYIVVRKFRSQPDEQTKSKK